MPSQPMPPQGAPAMPPQGAPAMPPQGAPVMAAEGGLMSLDVPDDMYEYAGGGIVAFQKGDEVRNPYRNYIPGRSPYRLPPEDEERLRKEGVLRGDFQKPSFSEALQQIRERFIDPAAAYLASDPLRSAIQGTQAPTPASPQTFAPVTGSGDLRRLEAAARDPYVTGPGLTPEQSMANIAAARPPVAPAAPAAAKPAGDGFLDIIRRSEAMANALAPTEKPTVPTVDQATAQTTELLKASGFDPELFTKQQQQLEEQKASLSEDRKTAQNMRILEAGLGIMAGTSANAFENIGKGATPAVQGLAKDIKEIKAAERAYAKAQMDLDSKRNDFALGKAKITQSTIDKAQERADSQAKELRDLKGGFAKTMLAGEIQKDIAKSMYSSRMTDFDKKWSIYEEAARKRGETPSPEGFVKMWGRSDAGTELQQLQFSKGLIESGIPLSDVQSMRQNIFGGQGTIAPPAPGTVMQGYRFKGGDPSNRNNWEKV